MKNLRFLNRIKHSSFFYPPSCRIKKALFLLFFLFPSIYIAFSQVNVTAHSYIDWTTKDFTSYLSIDMAKENLTMPSGKNTAMAFMKMKTPPLLKEPLLSFFVDNSSYLGDLVLSDTITFEELTDIIESGKTTPEVFVANKDVLTTTNTINLNDISRKLVKHKYPYNINEPLTDVSSKDYTGIIIDARGEVDVQGEYVKSPVYPCFFPKIWDAQMSLIYEKNIVDSSTAISKGIVHYNYKDDFTLYENIVGIEPFYIKTQKVYGRHRTDPLISVEDALRITSNKHNLELLKDGKVVILLDKERLLYNVTLPNKTPEYYASYKKVKQYIYENKIEDVEVTDYVSGLRFRITNLKFMPDSPQLLEEDKERIKSVATMLLDVIKKGEFTILVEGHTADLGRPTSQMQLSIERTQTVIKALVKEGVPESLFTYKGYGATVPVADNSTKEGRAQNRRVDIIARPHATYIQQQ